MTTYDQTMPGAARRAASRHPGARGPRVISVLGAALAVAAVAALGDPVGEATNGGEVVAALAGNGRVQGAGFLALLAAAALIVAAAHLGRRMGGTAGAVATSAGTATALLLATMYGAFTAGAIVTDLLLETTSAGLGEAVLLMVNVAELARFGAGLALLGAGAAAWRSGTLPRWVCGIAAVLAVAHALPPLAWLAAILAPVWLGVAAATARRRTSDEPA